ncbi:acyl-CoA/acyl-ACP dehydrogenase [Acidiphilium sp. PA]|uniref:acyl-CoA dehydrogenase family protein n=1 Tax=Acidiphilium sp. PA TaxID=2871705 RepID=UPI0022433309|nr:acyl-CoA dehydrogenase family protein [Acidiphilium sp. PA]MCW8305823.1 acyl-CoA/acyl-ACP dehydrogenase [Acidiphilium sp. PA]
MDGGIGSINRRTRSTSAEARDAVAAETAALAGLAATIDQNGLYPAAQLRALGAAGAYGLHLAGHTRLGKPSLMDAIEAMAVVSATCMSSGFCVWCQDSAGWYLEQTENADLRARLQPTIAAGAVMAGTGLSNAMKALSGTEDFRLRGKRVAGGYIISGILPWVSNLGEGHWFGTMFEDADDPAHRAMAMVRIGQEGVSIRQNAHFIALEGTGTYAVLFRRAFIADEQLLADPLGDMVARIRPGFVMLQTGMGLGVIDAAIGLMREANLTQAHCNTHLRLSADQAEDKASAIRERLATLAATPLERDRGYIRAVLQARVEVSEFCLEATQAAMLHWGACGYIHGSAVDRRVREAWFVAIITPSIRQLRREIAVLSGS